MGTVNVTFVGVCTHFLGVAPGIPHRVVLADASAFRFGIAMLVPDLTPDLGEESTPDHATYFAMPHFAILRMLRPDVQQTLQIQGVMQDGNIFSGVRLEIANAVGAGVSYQQAFDGVSHITSFVENYAFSPEVVLGGSAAVYFDLLSAAVTAFPEEDQAVDVTATIETNGPPELLATPFFGGSPHRFSLLAGDQDPDETVHLWVANQGMDCDTQENSFDYLLHYLTNRSGIPRRLTSATPGMDPHVTPFSQAILDAGANTLKTFDYPAVFHSPCLSLEGLLTLRNSYQKGRGFLVKRTDSDPILIVSVACSNSQYP